MMPKQERSPHPWDGCRVAQARCYMCLLERFTRSALLSLEIRSIASNPLENASAEVQARGCGCCEGMHSGLHSRFVGRDISHG